MKTIALAALCVAGLLPLFAGCEAHEKVVRDTKAKTIAVAEQDDGRTLDAAVGDRVMLSLPANITTGFDWRITAIDPAILKQAGESTYKQDSSAPGMVGVGGTRTWRLDIKAEGSTPLTLGYRRASQPDSQPAAKTFNITIKVTKQARANA